MSYTIDRPLVSIAEAFSDDDSWDTFEMAWPRTPVQSRPATEAIDPAQRHRPVSVHRHQVRDELFAAWNATDGDSLESGLADGM